MSDFVYAGHELDLFAHAKNWKAYWKSHIAPYLAGDVLEVGAGLGVNTALLCNGLGGRWVCLEPDRALAGLLRRSLDRGGCRGRCEVVVETVGALDRREQFDSILYIDVLEHTADARRELHEAVAHLRAGGALIVLAPAHQWLCAAFDEAIGHCRRYTRRTLAAEVPEELEQRKLVYLDSAGLLASLGNRAVLNRRLPTVRQIVLWDGVLVRCSRRLDRWLRYSVGKSVLGVWRTPACRSDEGERGRGVLPQLI